MGLSQHFKLLRMLSTVLRQNKIKPNHLNDYALNRINKPQQNLPQSPINSKTPSPTRGRTRIERIWHQHRKESLLLHKWRAMSPTDYYRIEMWSMVRRRRWKKRSTSRSCRSAHSSLSDLGSLRFDRLRSSPLISTPMHRPYSRGRSRPWKGRLRMNWWF